MGMVRYGYNTSAELGKRNGQTQITEKTLVGGIENTKSFEVSNIQRDVKRKREICAENTNTRNVYRQKESNRYKKRDKKIIKNRMISFWVVFTEIVV